MTKKVAIIHHSFLKLRGAERTLLKMLEVYPEADLYLLFGDRSQILRNLPPNIKIKFSWLHYLPGIKSYYKLLMPLWILAVRRFNLSDYDLVISSSSSVSRGVDASNAIHVTYLYTPIRYVWDLKETYLTGRSRLMKIISRLMATYLRYWDTRMSRNSDFLISISQFINQRSVKYNGRQADAIIYPPVAVSSLAQKHRDVVKGDYAVVISPGQPNKGFDHICELAERSGYEVHVIGDVSTRLNIPANIKLLGWLSEDEKQLEIARARCTLFLGVEDFGIAAVESVALGTPLLAMTHGSAPEIVTDANGLMVGKLGDLEAGLNRILNRDWDRDMMIESVLKFDEEIFKHEFKKFIDEKYSHSKTHNH